jgi:hypothetical protein
MRVLRGCGTVFNYQMVPGAGLEPARLAAGDFESPESTNFTTRAEISSGGIMAQCAL